LVIAAIDPPRWKYRERTARVAVLTRVLKKSESLADVEDTGLISAVPALQNAGVSRVARIAVPGRQSDMSSTAKVLTASSGVFRALGVPILAGRAFTEHDGMSDSDVVIVNRACAQAVGLTPTQVIGGRIAIRNENRWREIVGVVSDTRDVDLNSFPAQVFVPFAQQPEGPLTLVARVRSDAARHNLARAVSSVDPDIVVEAAYSFDDGMWKRTEGARVMTTIFGGLSLTAVILAFIGTYGVIASRMQGSRKEYAIRIAIGGSRAAVFRAAVLPLYATVILGAVLGLALGATLAPFAAGALYATAASVSDPWPYAASLCLTLIGAATAVFASFRHLRQLSPSALLRS
jgi:putative ABC transport system permease protein